MSRSMDPGDGGELAVVDGELDTNRTLLSGRPDLLKRVQVLMGYIYIVKAMLC
jgi:hypothetical protein